VRANWLIPFPDDGINATSPDWKLIIKDDFIRRHYVLGDILILSGRTLKTQVIKTCCQRRKYEVKVSVLCRIYPAFGSWPQFAVVPKKKFLLSEAHKISQQTFLSRIKTSMTALTSFLSSLPLDQHVEVVADNAASCRRASIDKSSFIRYTSIRKVVRFDSMQAAQASQLNCSIPKRSDSANDLSQMSRAAA
jgi:hypothetical protein